MTRRRWRPVAAAVSMTAVLVAILGSEQMIDGADSARDSTRPLWTAITAAPAWATGRLPDGVGLAVAAKLAALLLLVVCLCRLASGVRTRAAGFVAGWGAVAVASALAGLAYVPAANAAMQGELVANSGGATAAVVDAMNEGAVFGLYTGWLVGLAFALAVKIESATTGRDPVPIASWPPRPPVGTTRPNPAWEASQPVRPYQPASPSQPQPSSRPPAPPN